MTGTPRWERYSRVIDRFAGEPEHLDKMLREYGDPERAIARRREIDSMLESRIWWRKLGSFLRDIGLWIGAVGGGIGLIYGLWQFISGMH